MIYIVLYILLVIEGVICRKLKNGKKLFLVMSYLQLTLLLGLRGYDVGVDTKSYIDYFKLVSAGISGWMEPGITIIIRINSFFWRRETNFVSYFFNNYYGWLLLFYYKYVGGYLFISITFI